MLGSDVSSMRWPSSHCHESKAALMKHTVPEGRAGKKAKKNRPEEGAVAGSHFARGPYAGHLCCKRGRDALNVDDALVKRAELT